MTAPRSRRAKHSAAKSSAAKPAPSSEPRPVSGNPPPFNPARALSVRVLVSVLAGESYAASALDQALTRANLPGRDAGLCTHLVYGTLRYVPVLEAALAPLLRGETPPKARALLLTGAFEKLVLGTPLHAVVNEYVNLAKTGFAPPALVNAVLRRVEVSAALSPEGTLPVWLAEQYRAAYGERAAAVLADLLEPQPLWLRLTPAGRESLLAEGSELGAAYGDVVRVQLNRPLRGTDAFEQGWAQPINPASFACVRALGDVDGARVLDLAGGAGIKAAMLAAGGARVLSVDRASNKHHAARENLDRLGLEAQFFSADLTKVPALPPADFVLLDAPCTGSGTLRSHPEIKLRLTPDVVQEAAALQAQMLETAAVLTAPGGVLVYSVCSVTQAEGPEVVQQFLNANPAFQPEALPDLLVEAVSSGPGVLTVPLDGVDGFFIARLRRQALE
ncbi:tRNA/rRNA cytosine-C5-methylase [Deinococcus sp. KNUC1210]|uniref:RsmB/NOP family class I SAM-dependent RNA methyltransferase n=1 Tax=Deinococcus sp. KNUC1210 TaxID=2917691 RepID=UPI001EF0DAA4|nr:transcription antitermination factor NusB [Deinococcus sp. KNUC1210]ULH16300.1 tRNA/rRNA cytosine-C5-methylase [Deinococcus sp. KNUC1210]